MAARAGFSVAIRVQIRLSVALVTQLRQSFELCTCMAFFTACFHVFAHQRKCGIAMFESNLLPAAGRMAQHTIFPQVTRMGVAVTIGAIFKICLQHLLSLSRGMARSTVQPQMFPKEWERGFLMIKNDLVPTLRRMTEHAGCTQLACMLIPMAASAIRRGRCQLADRIGTGMAFCTAQALMFT